MNKWTIGAVAGIGLSFVAMSAFAGHGGGESRWDRLDTNGDGEITAEEMAAKNAEFLATADTDENGSVSKQEMQAFRAARRAERRAAHNPDKNGDGVIDRDEFMNAAGERFERMDKNGDGVISEDEKPKHRGRRRGGGK